jgi:hypothetical protein
LATNLSDWHALHPYIPKRIYSPRNKLELVAAIQDAERSGLNARALGTNMSLSTVGVAEDCIIRTDELNKHLSLPYLAGTVTWDSSRFRYPDITDRIETMLASPARAMSPRLVYVEAGIKIRDLLADLANTSGPGLGLPAMGAGGAQSLIGALATGTHGAEVDRQPLVDSIRSLHLVGPGGQEWWIERTNGWSDPAKLIESTPDWCTDTRIVYEDELFYSAIVAAGRLGVIYAMVLELEPEYWLEESRSVESFATVAEALRLSAAVGFDAPAGILRTRNGGQPGLCFLQVVLDANDSSNCWVMQRRPFDGPHDQEVGLGSKGDLLAIFCRPFEDQDCKFVAGLTRLLFGNKNVGDVLTHLLDAHPELLGPVVRGMLDNQLATPSQRVGPSCKILDQMDYGVPPSCYHGNASEFFFNARSTEYLEFVADMEAWTRQVSKVPGYIALRFIRQSDAYIAMERFPVTVAIELGFLRPWTAGTSFLQAARESASRHGGIPHWGQSYDESRSSRTYFGSSLDCFQYAIARIEDGWRPTFSTSFSRDSGLDPVDPLATLDARVHRPSVSLRQILSATESVLGMTATGSLRDVALAFHPSLRLNPDRVALERGRATTSFPATSLTDLARRVV